MAVLFNSVEIRNPEPENTETHRTANGLGFTPAGVLYSYLKHNKIRNFNLLFKNLIEEERDALQDFYDSMNGCQDSFTYTDHLGVEYTVVFKNDRLVWKYVRDIDQPDESYFPVPETEIFYPPTSKTCFQYEVEVELEELLL